MICPRHHRPRKLAWQADDSDRGAFVGRPRNRTLHWIAAVSITAVATMPRVLAAQGRVEVSPSDSAPTFNQLTLRILTLKVQTQTLRARISEQSPSAPVGAGDGGGWGPGAWRDSVQAIRAGITSLKADVRRLEQVYRRAGHAAGVRVATQLHALVTGLERAVAALAQPRDTHAARIEISHLSAKLEAMLQKVAEGEACCSIAVRH
jgi:hypothetical protein